MATLKNTTINDTGFLTLPNGTIAQRPAAPANAMSRYNTSLNVVESYIGNVWNNINQTIPVVQTGLQLYLDAGMSASYPTTGTSWIDLSGQNNNGTLTNGPTYNSANGGSIVFDGVNDFVSFTGTNGFNTVSQQPLGTLGIWANIERHTTFPQLAGFRNDSTYDFFFILLDTGGAAVNTEARLRTTSGFYDINVPYTSFFNTWTYITFVANINRTDLYLNGTLVGSNTNVTGNFGSSSGDFRIGLTPGGSFPTKGRISNVHFYNIALNASEVSFNFNALRGRYGV